MSQSMPAPPGKNCTECHCCPAVIAFGSELLCAACDDGSHPVMKQPAERTAEIHVAVPEILAATSLGQLPAMTKAVEKTVRQQFRKEGPVTRNSNIYRNRTTEEVRAQIIAADSTISHAALARQFDISDVTVYKIRREAGITVVKTPKEKVEPKTRTQRIERTLPENSQTAAATFMVTAKTLDAWWAALPLEFKASIFAGNHVLRMEGFVS